MSRSFTQTDLEIGIGNIPDKSTRTVSGDKLATTTESTISPNLTGRYPFPSVAAQLSIVSDNAADDVGGTGLNFVLVRGLTVSGSDWIDDSELLALDGTTPVVTTKSFIRNNSLIGAVAGSGGVNAGTITVTNGANILHSMTPNSNLTRTAIWSTASTLPAMVRNLILVGGKSVNEPTFTLYVTVLGLPTVLSLNLHAFEGLVSTDARVPQRLPGQTDFEITATSDVGTTQVNAIVEMTLVDES